jgi:hypothetical protein
VPALHPEKHSTNKLGRRKEANERGALTVWRAHRVRDKSKQKKVEREGGSHSLESIEQETSQDKNMKQMNKALTIWRY